VGGAFHVERWPSWWKYVLRVVELEPGAADGVGKRQRVLLRAGCHRTGSASTRAPPASSRRRAGGRRHRGAGGHRPLGAGPDDGGTLVRYTWDVRTTGWLMNLLAPVARPVFDWNHDQLMREGARAWPAAWAWRWSCRRQRRGRGGGWGRGVGRRGCRGGGVDGVGTAQAHRAAMSLAELGTSL
jgi:hypothetical protein